MLQKTKVLLTGGCGFLGSVLRQELTTQGLQVTRLGRSEENELVFDLSTTEPVLTEHYEIVVHNAGKAHVVPKSTEEADAFYAVNVTGTNHLLKALESSPRLPRAFVFISTIAVYGLTKGEGIDENHPQSAIDPYGKSKIEAEQLLKIWCDTKGVSLVILRLPLVAGVNPPGNLNAMIKALKRGFYLRIAGGKSRKSIVMAEDVARVIPIAVDHPGVYHLTDGHHPMFCELENLVAAQLGVKPPVNIPAALATVLGWMGSLGDAIMPGKMPVTRKTIEKITSTLTFDDQKARRVLGWNPKRVVDVFHI